MRARIIDAFIEEIQYKGIKCTMDDVASRLGISKRTLYQHFPSKAELLDTVVEQTLKEADEKTEQIVQDSSLSLLEKIRSVMMVLPNHYELYDLRILEQMKRHYPEQWKKINDNLQDDWDVLRTLIEQGMKENLIVTNNVSLIMKLIIDATNSTLDQRFYLENNISVTKALEEIVNILLHGLVIQEKN